MGQETLQLIGALNRIETDLDVQFGRAGLLQRWLDDHAKRLESLAGRIDEGLSRIDAILAAK
jgi:hypothetical protein